MVLLVEEEVPGYINNTSSLRLQAAPPRLLPAASGTAVDGGALQAAGQTSTGTGASVLGQLEARAQLRSIVAELEKSIADTKAAARAAAKLAPGPTTLAVALPLVGLALALAGYAVSVQLNASAPRRNSSGYHTAPLVAADSSGRSNRGFAVDTITLPPGLPRHVSRPDRHAHARGRLESAGDASNFGSSSRGSSVAVASTRTEVWNAYEPGYSGPSVEETRQLLMQAHGMDD